MSRKLMKEMLSKEKESENLKLRRKAKKEKLKEEGITLIALVVTIIILLILAGVTLNIALSDNGLFERAKQSTEKTKDKTEDEQVKLAVTDALIAGAGTLSTDNVREGLKSVFGEDRVTGDTFSGDGPWIFAGERNTYTIEKNGSIDETEKSDISISLTIKGTHVEEKDIPIPEGFVHVGGSINEGYVISDAKEDEGKDVDSDDLQGNQFVWVPVDKDQKITAKVISKEDITSIIITNPMGEKIKEESNVGKIYSNDSIEPSINGEYKIKVTTSKGETSRILEVYSLYAQNFWTKEADIIEELEESVKDIYGEMTLDEFFAQYGDGMSLDDYIAYEKSEIFKFEDTEHYENSVNEYGGFYIGRYEAGDSSAPEGGRTDESTNTGELVTQKNKYVYNYISKEDALSKAHEYDKSINTNITSSLLTGAAWDRTLGWLYETKNKTIEKIVEDSKSWGNYSDDTFSETKDLIVTGKFLETKANNIYDLAGNVREWTSEESGILTNGRGVRRGGEFSVEASIRPVMYRDDIPWALDAYDEDGFRLALFFKE